MKKIKSLISILLVLLLFAGTFAVPVNAGSYTDVPNGKYYSAAVEYCTSIGLVSGYPDGTFRPGRYVTRAEFVKMLYEATKLYKTNTYISFEDRNLYAGYSDPVYSVSLMGTGALQIYASNIVNGMYYYEEGEVNKDLKLAKKPCPFNDVPAGKWYTEPIRWAYYKGIVSGVSSTKFEPNRTITKQEATSMLMRWYFAMTKILKVQPPSNIFSSPTAYRNGGKSIYNYSYNSSNCSDANPNRLNYALVTQSAFDTKKSSMFATIYDENQINNWAMSGIVWAVTYPAFRAYQGNQQTEWSITTLDTTGTKWLVQPKSLMSRAQIITMIYKMLQSL